MFKLRLTVLLFPLVFGLCFTSEAFGFQKLGYQSGGKIIVAYTRGRNIITVRRFNYNGTLDTSFGTGGRAELIFGSSTDISEMTVAADQKIVVVGHTYNTSGGTDFLVGRFQANGSVDTTFGGGDGVVVTRFGASDSMARAVDLQDDGKIVVAGFSVDSTRRSYFALARYTTSGVLDTSFGFFGIQISGFAGKNAEAWSVTVDPYENITVGGNVRDTTAPYNHTVGLMRFRGTGVLDTSFDGDGKAIGPSDGNRYFASMGGDGNSRIIVGSRLERPVDYSEPEYDFEIIKFTSSGVLDSTFGVGGVRSFSPSPTTELAQQIVRQADGKLVQVGHRVTQSGVNPTMLVRYTADGRIDTTYGSGGRILTGPYESVSDATQFWNTTNQLLVLFNVGTGTGRAALSRYDVNGNLVPVFGTGGTTVFTY